MTTLAKFSIKAQLLGLVVGLLTGLATLGLFALVEIRTINVAAQEIQNNWLPSVRWTSALKSAATSYRGILPIHILNTEDAAMASIERDLATQLDKVAEARGNYEPLISSPEERKIFEEFASVWSEYRREADNVLEHSRKNDNIVARDLNSQKALPLARRADDLLDQLVDLNNRGVRRESASEGDIQLGTALGYWRPHRRHSPRRGRRDDGAPYHHIWNRVCERADASPRIGGPRRGHFTAA